MKQRLLQSISPLHETLVIVDKRIDIFNWTFLALVLLGPRHFGIVVLDETLDLLGKMLFAEVIDPFVAVRSDPKRVCSEDSRGGRHWESPWLPCFRAE